MNRGLTGRDPPDRLLNMCPSTNCDEELLVGVSLPLVSLLIEKKVEHVRQTEGLLRGGGDKQGA